MTAFTKTALPALLVAGFVGLGITSANAASFEANIDGASDGGPAIALSANTQRTLVPQITLVDLGTGASHAGPVAIVTYGVPGQDFASSSVSDAPRNAAVVWEDINVKN